VPHGKERRHQMNWWPSEIQISGKTRSSVLAGNTQGRWRLITMNS